MSDSIELGFHVVGGESPKSQIPKMRDPRREQIASRINKLTVHDDIKIELFRKLKNYPDGALVAFWDNLSEMVETLKVKRAKNEI